MSHHFSTIGQVATDPKLFTPAGGAEFCTFRLASGERRFDAEKQEWVDADPNWFTVNTFRSLARHAQRSLRKGDRVVVAGRLRVRQWETEEKRGTSVEIDADGIGHDMRFGVSYFTKTIGVEPGATQKEEANGSRDTSDTGDAADTADTGSLPAAPAQAPSQVTAGPAAAAPPAASNGDDRSDDGSGLAADGFTPKLASAS